MYGNPSLSLHTYPPDTYPPPPPQDIYPNLPPGHLAPRQLPPVTEIPCDNYLPILHLHFNFNLMLSILCVF